MNTTAGKGVQLMQKRMARVIEWNSCIDVPLVRGLLVHVVLLDRCASRQPSPAAAASAAAASSAGVGGEKSRAATVNPAAHADLLVGAQVLADQCKQSAGDSLWVSPTIIAALVTY